MAIASLPLPARDVLLLIFRYNPDGTLTKLTGKKETLVKGSETAEGYRVISLSIDGVVIGNFRLHRLIYQLHFGDLRQDEVIDHIDGDPRNNRIENLRKATHSQNRMNSRRVRRNTSGFKGVHAHGDKFRAQIRIGHKRFDLGVFSTPEEAHKAYCSMAEKLYGNFARFD